MADAKKTVKAPVKKTEKGVKAAQEVKTREQLHEELTTLRTEYRESQRSHRGGELVNPHVLTMKRKAIARTLTALKQAETAAKEEN